MSGLVNSCSSLDVESPRLEVSKRRQAVAFQHELGPIFLSRMSTLNQRQYRLSLVAYKSPNANWLERTVIGRY